MILEALALIGGYYIFCALSTYVYAVLKGWEFTGRWNFDIKDGYIGGVCKYPRFLLSWAEWIVNKVRSR